MSVSISAAAYPRLGSVDATTRPVVAVQIVPAAAASAPSRRAFHLAMLLDVSGSMGGERIEALRRTLHLLVDALSEHDILTLITYNGSASVRADCVDVVPESRATLHATIDTFQADGGTNMEAAIGSLLVLAATPGKPALDAVFILTDGHINGGMTSSAGLLRLLAHQMNAGVPINTLGYGADHNSRLLRDMALRSRGTYTYADAGEVLPAIIGDIMGGLEAEVGRQARLSIPDDWTCLELQPVQDGAYCVGTLIADKPQWVVLEGAEGTSTAPILTLTWTDSATRSEQSVTAAVDGGATTITMLEVVEQRERCRVAAVFAAVTEDLEAHRLDYARTKLSALASELSASFAKDTPFVIRLQAQVDDMLDSISREASSPPASPAPMVGGLGRSPLMRALWPAPAPSVTADIVSRLASNTTVLVNQRGIMSGAGPSTTTTPGVLAPPPPFIHAALFSSPSQRSASNRMTHAYSESTTVAARASPIHSGASSDDDADA